MWKERVVFHYDFCESASGFLCFALSKSENSEEGILRYSEGDGGYATIIVRFYFSSSLRFRVTSTPGLCHPSRELLLLNFDGGRRREDSSKKRTVDGSKKFVFFLCIFL